MYLVLMNYCGGKKYDQFIYRGLIQLLSSLKKKIIPMQFPNHLEDEKSCMTSELNLDYFLEILAPSQ